MKPKKDKRLNNGRDWLVVAIIKGATKAGIKPDLKKERNKKLARKRVDRGEE